MDKPRLSKGFRYFQIFSFGCASFEHLNLLIDIDIQMHVLVDACLQMAHDQRAVLFRSSSENDRDETDRGLRC